ncbi:hypothetical protein G7Y89_g11558 [Cudoniella acicularis]|uniref:Uncharacterized protein n=1 Tax=Cudoniella acicularis TaxID=354080 RepID=A0A8H4RAN1_9HELO|nr:hypothetical protein G7Y89_g11558 [Cudoniella acicularis]
MNLSGIATEIRLKIFSELLVLSEPINFVADYSPPSPPLFRQRRDGLYLAILRPARAILHEAHVRNLQLIRDTCTSIQTLELLIPPERYNYALSYSLIAIEALDLLNTRLKSILSLKETIVHFQVYPEGDVSDDLIKKMNNYGWAVKVIKLLKRVWISWDNRVEFDNEEDCNAYNKEQFRREEERREEEEKELWLDEYYRRRCDPY